MNHVLARMIPGMLILLLAPVVTLADPPLFFDDFEDGLAQWVGVGGGPHSAIVVTDPLDPGNRVVTFTELSGTGDIFSIEVPVTSGVLYSLSFKYLGIPGMGGEDGNLGGFIGYAEDTPGEHVWLAGTTLVGGGALDDPLIDDGQWHWYCIEFDPFAFFIPSSNTIRVMVEDYWMNGVPGDAFFDDIELKVYEATPTQSTTWGSVKSLYRGPRAL